jgi:hypothetical protein
MQAQPARSPIPQGRRLTTRLIVTLRLDGRMDRSLDTGGDRPLRLESNFSASCHPFGLVVALSQVCKSR